MTSLVPGILPLIAALAVAAAVAALTLRLHPLPRAAPAGRPGGEAASVPAPRAPRWNVRRALRSAIALLGAASLGWAPRSAVDRLARWLRMAGHPLEWKPGELVAWMELCAACGLCTGVAVAIWLDLSFASWLAFAAAGAAAPLLWLRDKVRQRHFAITRALPWHLDLLTLSVEAGLDFAAALGKVVEKGRTGPLQAELATALKELKLGKTREEALRGLAARVELPALGSLVQALIQADKMGTPLGKVLRILSTQLRVERTQRAEKLANEAPVKLLLPLVGFIFPTIFIMLFGPIAWQVFFSGGF